MSAAFDKARLGDLFGHDVVHDPSGVSAVLNHQFGAESFLKGHFPGFPVVPGVILLDGMILAGLHVLDRRDRRAAPVSAIEVASVTFNRPVTPGPKVTFSTRLLEPDASTGRLEARASVMVDGVRHARASFAFLTPGADAP